MPPGAKPRQDPILRYVLPYHVAEAFRWSAVVGRARGQVNVASHSLIIEEERFPMARVRLRQVSSKTRSFAVSTCALVLLVWAGPPVPALAATMDTVATETIPLPNLQQPIEILIDQWGVPHIHAKNETDLFFAQGVNAAGLFELCGPRS